MLVGEVRDSENSMNKIIDRVHEKLVGFSYDGILLVK